MSSPSSNVNLDPSKLEDIPLPDQRFFGLLGHIPEMDPGFPSQSVWKMADLCGPIFKLKLAEDLVVVSSQQYVNEICDEDRFEKLPSGALVELRSLIGDGLFTAYPSEPNWGKAHRLLVPAFGPLGIRKMFDDMLDISSQMILKWDRLGAQNEIHMADDLTRLAFDTIGLCAFSFRFNEFYGEQMHPFAEQMARVLLASGKRAFRPGLVNQVLTWSENERQEDISKMHAVADEIVRDRKAHPQPDCTDLLNTMLLTADRETGERLSDENIRFNLVTFLVAGHETTSDTLCFLYYNLLKNPETLIKAQQEVDKVVGDSVPTVEHLPSLLYLDACIKETLRLSSPITTFVVKPKKDTSLGGRYKVSSNDFIWSNLLGLHTDPVAWGEDAHVFRPERMLNGGFASLPPNSWKPFGSGMRACIGRGFAEQEMLINAALVLQKFQLEFADPSYELLISSTLTIKPKGFKMRVRRRHGKGLLTGMPGGGVVRNVGERVQKAGTKSIAAKNSRPPITILFGGNTGTCEGFALEFERKATEFGFRPTVIHMDAATENLPTDQPVIIVTSSFEGKPPDNAKKFVAWLELTQQENKLDGVKYTVFGVGSSDWARTYQRIPKLVDESMTKLGASRILEAGFADVKGSILGPWEEWSETLLQKLGGSEDKVLGERPSISVSITASKLSQTIGGEEMNVGLVVHNYEIAGADVGLAKRHMDICLPEGLSYQPGDYLVVQPKNPEVAVRRVLRHFGICEDDIMHVQGSKKKFIPKEPMLVIQFLESAVELNTPITKRQLAVLAASANGEAKVHLESLAADLAYKKLLQKRYSIIDVLEDHPTELDFGSYIDMLQPLTSRQYSISSSPLQPHNGSSGSNIASITFDVHESPSLSGHGVFYGVASTYMASRTAGDRIHCYLRPTNINFRLPTSPDVPILMVAAGTGIAPMRAFLQERACIAETGVKKLAPAILFYGCRDSNKDFLYNDELRSWEDKKIVTVKPAFSRPLDGSNPRYVQDVIWDNREEVSLLFNSGGKIFLCGSAARLGQSVAEVFKKIYMEQTNKTTEEAELWLESVKTDRYVSDVY
ncbi:cytochrome P450 [Penicillium cf. viridicatum]|uniref:Bifunctional cytochrome P450/NADPH--P450 reductase n=1 Tax=Penicillium cf. viridicatum TaxID=2972119 RepID=A0A9W9M8T1_9EURO|nr:cytochrome P450 [Penicillium cf. viridicatum]